MRTVRTYSFELAISIDAYVGDRDAIDTLLYDAGLDDGLVAWVGDQLTVQVDREAGSLAAAAWEAITQVDSIAGLQVARLEPVDLVSAGEIARRRGKTKAWASLVISGKRGPGDFPAHFPLQHLPTFMWRWSDVDAWFDDGSHPDAAEFAHEAWFMSTINSLLDLRRLLASGSPGEDDAPPLHALLAQVAQQRLAGDDAPRSQAV